MGLAASQARLLSITSRMADNELRSQSINNAKMRLASESALASENYINTLNNADMMFSNYAIDGTAMTQMLTYNALMSYSSYNNQYGLVNSAGQILVSEAEAELFAQANGNLNEYLLAHGIEYDTTYFDAGVDGEAIHIENPDYPQEFQSVPAETLKTWYENYDSYVNSAEYRYYNQYLSQYLDDSRAYRGALRYLLGDYTDKLTREMLSKFNENDKENWILQGYGAVKYVYDKLEPYFISDDGTTNNVFVKTYNQLAWNMQKWIRVDSGEAVGVGYPGTSIGEANAAATTTEDGHKLYKYFIGWDFRELAKNSDGIYEPVGEDTRNYIAFDVYEENGIEKCKVYTSFEGNKDKDHSNLVFQGGEYAFQVYKRDNNGNLIKDAQGNYTYETTTVNIALSAYETALYCLDSYCKAYNQAGYIYGQILDPNGNKISTNYDDNFNMSYNYVTKTGNKINENYTNISVIYESAENYFKLLQDAVKSLVNLTNNDNYFNITAFGNAVLQDYEGSRTFIDDYNKDVLGSGMKYSDYINNYEEAVIGYFGLIEGKEAQDPNNIKYSDLTQFALFNLLSQNNAQETYEHFVDIDTLLQLIKDHEQDTGNTKISYSDEFRNIVRACIIDGMVDEYGEPKYTWIDRTDTTNTGNATAKAQWYTNLFERMQKGYKILENGLASSSEWLEFALQTGIVTMEQVDKSYVWRSIEYKTCANITEQTDSTNVAVAKAEAEYNKVMREIEAKDRAFDMELKNIDTEHSALEKEYDSIKNAVKANIERTMKFDQSS